MPITFSTARNAPRDIEALGVPVHTEGPVPRSAGVSRKSLAGGDATCCAKAQLVRNF